MNIFSTLATLLGPYAAAAFAALLKGGYAGLEAYIAGLFTPPPVVSPTGEANDPQIPADISHEMSQLKAHMKS